MNYFLENGKQIDKRGLIEAFEGFFGEVYFLDTESGDIGIILSENTKEIERLSKTKRYEKIPSIPFDKQLFWFTAILEKIEKEDLKLHKKLLTEIEKHENKMDAIISCEDILENESLESFVLWEEIFDNFVLKIIRNWLVSLPVSISFAEDEVSEDDDLDGNEKTLGDFLEEKAKRERFNKK